MSRTIFVCIVYTVFLSGCTTPAVILKNETTGQIERCGGGATGSMSGGLIGYNIEKSNDEECVRNLEANGFKRTQKLTVENENKGRVNGKANPPNNSNDIYTELTKLDDLRKKGIISEAEFQTQKKKILNEN